MDVATGARRTITDRDGPDRSPAASPDGQTLAWLGYDDERRAYQQTELYLQGPGDEAPRLLTADFDHGLSDLSWTDDGRTLLAQATVRGQIHLVEIDLEGTVRTVQPFGKYIEEESPKFAMDARYGKGLACVCRTRAHM